MRAANHRLGRRLGRTLALWRRTWQWLVIGALAVAAVVLGHVGLWKHFTAHGDPRSFWQYVYFDLHLFVFEPGEVTGPVPWELTVARLLAPIVSAWAAVKALAILFREQVQMLHLRFARGHVVLCGFGRKGHQLAQDFRAQGDRVVVIETEAGDETVRACRDLGATFLAGSATDLAVLRRARADRARDVVAITGDDGANVDVAVLTWQLVRDRPAAIRSIVRCFVHVVDLKLCAFFEQQPIVRETGDFFEARIFNLYQDSARLLLEAHPLERGGLSAGDPRTVHLVVVGLGQMGEAVLLQAARIGHYANGRRLRVTVIDRAAEERRRRFAGRYPGFEQVCDAAFLAADVEDGAVLAQLHEWSADPASLVTVVVCLDDDSQSLSCGLNMLSHLEGGEVPVIVRLSEEAGLACLLEGGPSPWAGRVHAFGMTRQVVTRASLLKRQQDVLARAIHEDFVRRRRGSGRPEDDPAMQPWDRLDQGLKSSNRQQADHIPVKLRAAGCRSGPARPGGPSPARFTDDEVELLARMEHDRWVGERRLAGWTPGPRDVARKTSPYLVPWDEVPDDVRQYDREAVREVPRVLRLVGQEVYRVADPAPAGPPGK